MLNNFSNTLSVSISLLIIASLCLLCFPFVFIVRLLRNRYVRPAEQSPADGKLDICNLIIIEQNNENNSNQNGWTDGRINSNSSPLPLQTLHGIRRWIKNSTKKPSLLYLSQVNPCHCGCSLFLSSPSFSQLSLISFPSLNLSSTLATLQTSIGPLFCPALGGKILTHNRALLNLLKQFDKLEDGREGGGGG